jgi:hypothetical protein
MALAVSPQSGMAQEQGRSPSAEELWRDYPLTTDEKARGAGTAEQDAPGRAGPVRKPAAAEQSDDQGIAAAVIVLLGLLVLLAFSVPFGVRAIQRRSRAGKDPPAPPGPRPSPRTWAALRSSAWTAEIQWRSDADASRFRVVASPPGGEDEVTLVESLPLEFPPRSDAAVDSLVYAVADLERSLVMAGWQVTDAGTSWFGRRFVWPRTDRAPEQVKELQRA